MHNCKYKIWKHIWIVCWLIHYNFNREKMCFVLCYILPEFWVPKIIMSSNTKVEYYKSSQLCKKMFNLKTFKKTWCTHDLWKEFFFFNCIDVFHSQFIKFALLFIYLIIDRLIKNVLIYEILCKHTINIKYIICH